MIDQVSVEDRDDIDTLRRQTISSSGDVAFDEPWQLRVFALAVAAHRSGHYEWADFQSALIASIATSGEQESGADVPSWHYFEHWLDAVETALSGGVTFDSERLDAMTRDIVDAPANRNHHEPHFEPVAIDPASGS